MIVLGVFGPGANSSAALIKEGKLISLIEEERLSRIKTSPNGLPLKSASKCLEMGKINISDVDHVAWGWDCNRYKKIMEKENKLIKKNNEITIQYFKFNSCNPNLIEQEFNIFFNKKI